MTIIEWAPIKLAAGSTEADLLAASDAFQKDFLGAQAGFLRRELVRKAAGEFVDIVHWRSEADARAIMEQVQSSAACAAYFSAMDMSGSDATGGIGHYTSLAVYA